MKKHISLLLVLSLVLSVFAFPVFADEVSYASSKEDINRVFGLNLIPHTTAANLNLGATISRAELAWVIDNIYNYKNALAEEKSDWNFFGDAMQDATELKDVPPAAYERFTDVPASHWAYAIVDRVTSSGLMNGVSQTQFMPDEKVTLEQLVKTLTVLMGYEGKAEVLGGYPAGYMKVASDLKLLKNVNCSGPVTNDVLIRVLDNCLEARLMEYNGMEKEGDDLYAMYVSSDKTFLTGLLGIDKAEGVVTGNALTSLYGKSLLDKGQCAIDNVVFKVQDDMASSLVGLIGRDVECYYISSKKDKNNNYVIYMALTGKDKATEIDAESFVKYENHAIYYSKNNDIKRIMLSSPYGVIYNGKAMSRWENSVFDIADGDMTIVSGISSRDYVIINNYETWFTGAVDYAGEKIFNSLGNDMIVFDDYEYVTIYRADGTLGTIEDIEPSMVLNVTQSDDTVSIYVCTGKEVVTITGLSYLDGETVLETADGEYVVADVYQNFKKRLDYKIGDEVTIYTNKFGKVAWMVNGAVLDLRTGYVFDSTFGGQGFVSELGFKIYDVAEQKAFTYFAGNEKIRVSNNKGEESKLEISDFWTNHGAYRGIVRYSLDKNGLVSYIEYPITDVRYAKDNKLKLIADLNSVNYNTNNFGGKALANASTKVICVDPDNIDNEDGYSISSVSSLFAYSDGKKYTVTCYGIGKDSVLSTHVIYQTATRAGSINITPTTHVYMGIVKKIYSTYDDDEGAVPAMDILGFKNSSSSAGADAVIKLRKDVVPTTILKHEFKGKVEPGDVIVYGMDREGYVNEIRVLWDENAVNPDSPSGARGMLTDCKGYYGTGEDEPSYNGSDLYIGDATKLPNPMSIETKTSLDGKEHGKNSSSFAGGPFLVHYGFPAMAKEGTFIMTSQDITVEEYDPYGQDGKHIVRAWNVPTNVISVELSGKNKVVAAYGGSAALNPIKSNEVYKSDCSRMITISAYGLISKLIVFNGSFE